MSDADNASWAVWVCVTAVTGVRNNGGLAVCSGCCRRLVWCTELLFVGAAFADHPDKQRSAGFGVGGLRVFLVPDGGWRMLLCSDCCRVAVLINM